MKKSYQRAQLRRILQRTPNLSKAAHALQSWLQASRANHPQQVILQKLHKITDKDKPAFCE